jgi:hypothetical protein
MLFEKHGIVLNFDLFQITGLMEEIIMPVDIEQQEVLIQLLNNTFILDKKTILYCLFLLFNIFVYNQYILFTTLKQ